jgi:hypothetical protein
MKSRWILALLVALVCMAAPAMAQPAPFVISGHIYDASGNPCNGAWVRITNTNTSVSWDADNSSTSNYYQLVLDSDDVSVDNVLSIEASGCSQSKTVEHTVTQINIGDGWFSQDITLEPAPGPDLIVTAINAYHYDTYTDAWFNLTNEIDVTVKNIGDVTADESNVSLYIEDVFFGELSVPSLAVDADYIATFTGWMPVGEDCRQSPCVFEWSSEDYNLTAVADCDNDVAEGNEMNNETTVVDTACYNGYTGDEPLENVAHGTLHGGMLFTTGDGQYTGLYYVGAYMDTHYDIELPAGASVELAHLNVYYTWNKPLGTCPEMEVSITTPGGITYSALPLMKAYNDIKCECAGSAWVLPWGNYVYDLTDYITENGTYTVRVTNACTACINFCPAAPGIVLVYEDANAPQIEYWINEGADKLIGGRRADGGSLAWWECINNATFPASTKTGDVVNATLGVVSPWGGGSWQSGMTNYLFFNGVKLGTGVYHGYSNPCSYTIDSLSMEIGGSNAQVGINATNVTDHYLKGSDNMVGQADDGDCMMPANAFLVVEYEGVPGTCGDVTGNNVVKTGDVILLSNYVGYTGYTLQNEWAGDVTGNGVINTGDVILLSNFVGYTGYSLNCTG